MEAANVAAMSVAVQRKLNQTHFDDLSSTPPDEIAPLALPGWFGER